MAFSCRDGPRRPPAGQEISRAPRWCQLPSGALDELRVWALRHLGEPLTVDRMAREACLSRRTLIRRFHDETGLPPMHWLRGARIDRARELLEASDAPLAVVARLSGLGTPANLRTLFKRHAGVPPSTYRSTFRRPGRGTMRA
jgi:transcriptional regulator GlxA family with amidase domain